MSIKTRIAGFVATVFGTVASVSATIDTANLTSDINAALDVFWLLPQSIVDNFGILITLVLLGAILGLIAVVLNFIKKLLAKSTTGGNQ